MAERPLTPQPYELPLPRGPRLPRHWEKAALAAASVIALVVPLGLVAYYWWEPRPEPVSVPVQQPPLPPPPDLRAQLEEVLGGFECADLDYSIGRDSNVLVSGFVAAETDLATSRERIAAVEGAGAVAAPSVEVQPWPFCEILLITAPLRERNRRDGLGLDLDVRGGEMLYQGDVLVVEIATPAYDAYLYLDYVQQDGWVGHVAHAPADQAADRARDRFPYDTGYDISEPFGREMIVLTASPQPLFPAPRPDEFELVRDYLPELRRRIEELQAARPDLPLAATHVFITTQPASGRL